VGRRAVLAGALAAALALLPVQAGAHAFVSRTEPRQSANLAESPSQVRIWFDGPVEKMYLEVRVETEDKRRVDQKDARPTTPWSRWGCRGWRPAAIACSGK
jgi:methionine-rich copper-binding protein CopC